MKELWRAALRPWEAFPRWAQEALSPGRALLRMLRWRLPLALIEALLGWASLRLLAARLPRALGPLIEAQARAQGLELDPAELHALLPAGALPALGRAWPWLLAAAPVILLAAWLHNAVWDHACLWILGGLRERRGFRATLAAEAEAFTVGAVGAALGLLGLVPGLGLALALPLGFLQLWFWGLRGFALAARHGCPAWKGVAATGLHLLLMACCGLGLLGLSVAVLRAALP